MESLALYLCKGGGGLYGLYRLGRLEGKWFLTEVRGGGGLDRREELVPFDDL